MFDFWREATAASVPGFLRQSGRRRPENVSILSSLICRRVGTYVRSDNRTKRGWPYSISMGPHYKLTEL